MKRTCQPKRDTQKHDYKACEFHMTLNRKNYKHMNILYQHIDQIKRLCELNKVTTLFAFGSVTTDRFKQDSDIDLVVEIDDNGPISYSNKYFNLKF